MNPDIKKQTDLARRMVEQTQAEGFKPFAGSSYDTAITPDNLAQQTANNYQVPPPVTVPTAPVLPEPQPDLYAPIKEENDIYNALSLLTPDTNALGSKESAQIKADEQFGVQEKRGVANRIKGEYDALTQEESLLDLRNQQAQEQNRSAGGSSFQLDANNQATQRLVNTQKLGVAIKKHQLASDYAVANGDLGTALQLADRAVTIEYQQKKDILDARLANIELALKDPKLTEAQKKRADAQKLALDKQALQLQEEIQEKKDTNDARLKAINSNLTNPNLQKAMAALNVAKTPADVAGILAVYGLSNGEKKNNEVVKLDNGQTVIVDRDTGKVVSNIGGAKMPVGGGGTFQDDLDALVSNTMNLIPSLNGKNAFRASIDGARNDSDKFNSIATVVLKNSPGEVRNDFVKQKQGVGDIEKAINLLDKGVETGLFQAGAQYTYNVFGQDFDPNLARINAYITSAIQPYRSSITGAAWGEQEDIEYTNLFGSTKYTPEALKTRLETIKEILLTKSIGALNSQVAPLGGTPLNYGVPDDSGLSEDDAFALYLETVGE